MLILEREVLDETGAKHPLKIGVIGFVPPQIVQWDKAHLDGKATTIDIVDAATKHVPDVKRAGADIVVALCHSALPAAIARAARKTRRFTWRRWTDRRDPQRASAFDVSGRQGIRQHSWRRRKGRTLHGKPPSWRDSGQPSGLVDLELTRDATGWKVAKFAPISSIYDRVDRKVVPKVESEIGIIAAVQADHDATLNMCASPWAPQRLPIHSYYSLVADDASVKLVAEAQAWYVADLLKTTPYKDLPLLSAAAPFKAGGRGGELLHGDQARPSRHQDMADIYIYPNTIRAVKVTGAQVREWLERSAGIYNQVDVAKAASRTSSTGNSRPIIST
jgi:2',3'-cyclic-nucleotide 2'-phosphodiesterase/3'-nucleotidase